MTQILTIIVEPDGERTNVHYFASDGITPAAAINALQAVEGKLQQEALEAEVQRRVQAAAHPDPPPVSTQEEETP